MAIKNPGEVAALREWQNFRLIAIDAPADRRFAWAQLSDTFGLYGSRRTVAAQRLAHAGRGCSTGRDIPAYQTAVGDDSAMCGDALRRFIAECLAPTPDVR
jgi:hypothetical protein